MNSSGKQPIEVILEMLRAMVGRKASDLFICVGFPPAMRPAQVDKRTYFGGLYQKVVITR